jgi:sugar lactone lactonase YvrE
MNSYRDFLAGRFTGLSLTRDGRLTLAPEAQVVLASAQPVVWSVVAAPDGTLYAATGHRGRVFRVDPAGKSSVLWTAGEPEVFALALDPKGVLYAATSPDGAIYRIENGKASLYFHPKTKYIWALAFAPDGTLYAGTGDQGVVYRISGAGKGEVYYETGQSHITCLALDAQGRLLAGSEPNGLIYRITAKDQAFILYDASLPEVRALVPQPDGSIYAAALGGSMNRRTAAAAAAGQTAAPGGTVTTSSTTVTVDASAEEGGIDVKPKPEAAKPTVPQGGAVAPAPTALAAEATGVDKAAIYRINPDNTVESLWTSKEENVYDMLVSSGDVLFSTDGQGRIYRMGPDRKVTLLAQTNEGEATRLLATPQGLLAATGDMGKLFRFAAGSSATGSFESPVHDASAVARWGRLSWRGELPAGSRVVFRTRSGNSIRPDRTWSEWSGPLTEAAGAQIPSPNARYIQWKAEFAGARAAEPVLDSVTVAYLPQNTPPVVRTLTVTSQVSAQAGTAKAAAQAQSGGAYTVTVTDTPDAAVSQTSAGTPTQPVLRTGAEQLVVTWQADDPEGDRLAYTLWFRGEGEKEWKLLKSNLSETTYALDADAFADGKYTFRIEASDAPANSPVNARTAELTSAPILIDHTPPTITVGAPKRSGQTLEVAFEANDAASPIRRAEYSLDAAPWVPVDPVDGILDSARERFMLKLGQIPAGEHLLVFRAIDSAGNAGTAKLLLR